MTTRPELRTWVSLNKAIMKANEVEANQMLKDEIQGEARARFMLRVHCRINRLRALRERKELQSKAKS